jgi:hypothetical protein
VSAAGWGSPARSRLGCAHRTRILLALARARARADKPYNCPRPMCKMVCEKEPSCGETKLKEAIKAEAVAKE